MGYRRMRLNLEVNSGQKYRGYWRGVGDATRSFCSMAGAALGRTAGHDDAELLSSAELKSVRAGEGEDALDVDVIVVKH